MLQKDSFFFSSLHVSNSYQCVDTFILLQVFQNCTHFTCLGYHKKTNKKQQQQQQQTETNQIKTKTKNKQKQNKTKQQQQKTNKTNKQTKQKTNKKQTNKNKKQKTKTKTKNKNKNKNKPKEKKRKKKKHWLINSIIIWPLGEISKNKTKLQKYGFISLIKQQCSIF